MEHDGKSRPARWRLPRVLGAAASAIALAATLSAGPALASPMAAKSAAASPAATAAPQYSLEILTSVKAKGHTWDIDLISDGADGIDIGLYAGYNGNWEDYEWQTSAAFAPTSAKELKATSTGHARFSTGKALSPVLSVAAAFTPVKAAKGACSKGSEIVYTGKVAGALTLVTGLRGVKFSLKFTGKTGAWLYADKSCVPAAKPSKKYCQGGGWYLAGTKVGGTAVGGFQWLTSKPKWTIEVDGYSAKTASKWLTYAFDIYAADSVPKVSAAKKTVSVAGAPSGPITGAAVISYGTTSTSSPYLCYLNGKKYKETVTSYSDPTTIKITHAFQAHALLAGTVTAKPGPDVLSSYSVAKLSSP